MADNKVVYGLKNVHYAVITQDVETGGDIYGTPIALKGATEISLEPKGETSDFYADDMLYYTTTTNAGYECTLTLVNITNEFRQNVLGEDLETLNKIMTENTNQRTNKIAFMFEFDGDQKAIRHCLYNCTVTRPSLTSATKTETAEPQPQELTLVSAPREDGVVKRSTTVDTPSNIYDAWYNTVYEPAVV
jgi:phi13 family phage major tail protein